MSELTIATPLSGEEIVEAVQDELRRRLQSDCNLNPVLAYEAFRFVFAGKMTLKDMGREVEIVAEGVLERGPQEKLKDVGALGVNFTMVERPPNAVRQEHGLPIPTLVDDGQGRKEMKGIRYKRKGEEKR
jgi:hypothetical protein